ncbi:MAG: TonB-dependent receptor, partial [Reyranella sp.]
MCGCPVARSGRSYMARDAGRARRRLGLAAAILWAVSGEVILVEPAAAQSATQGIRSFNIPAQPLADALVQFGYQSGLQVAADGNATAAASSTAVSGSLTPQQALARLLAGTGLTFQFTGPNTVQVQRPAVGPSGATQLDPVQVQGAFPVPPQAMIDNLPPPYAGGQVATGGQLGLLGNRGVMDTPFNQTNFTAKKAQEQQAKTVRDVLLDDPSVRAYAPEGGIGRDNFFIRGFDAGSGAGISYGGLFGLVPNYSPMVEMAERIEVLKGPSAMLTGMSPLSVIGGTVNIVPKRAPDEALTQITANYISNGQFGGHIDVARRFGDEKQVGARFNGVYRAGQTSVNYNTDERGLAVLGLDFRGERVRLSTDFGFQRQYVGGLVPYLGVANGVALPWAPNVRNNVGQPWTFTDHKDLFGV